MSDFTPTPTELQDPHSNTGDLPRWSSLATDAQPVTNNGHVKFDHYAHVEATVVKRPAATAKATITISGDYTMQPLPEAARLNPDLATGACPWLDAYEAFSRRWSPRGIPEAHTAVGVWSLSTVAARRIMLPIGKERYSSLYIAQVARTSGHAKTTTAMIGVNNLGSAGLGHLLLPDEITPPALIKQMSAKLPTDWAKLEPATQKRLLARFAHAGQRGWFYDEFGGKVNAMMSNNGGTMTEYRRLFRKLDDGADHYDYESITHGTMSIDNPYIALLANMTPKDLAPFARRDGALWGDGTWARFAFIAPSPSAKRSKAKMPNEERPTDPALVNPLVAWHKRLGVPAVSLTEKLDKNGEPSGEFALEVGELKVNRILLGDGVFDAYSRYDDALGDLIEQSSNQDLSGNYARFPEMALRVAMLLASLADSRIEMPHWARAQAIIEGWRQGLHHLYAVVTDAQSTIAESIEDKVIGMIQEHGPLTARHIYQNTRGLNAEAANKLLASLVRAGVLEKIVDGRTEKFFLMDEPK